jgi:hypothetical protein
MTLGSIIFPVLALSITVCIFWGVRNLIRKIEEGEDE